MPRIRFFILALTAVMLLGPAAALASGPSAGDNQYTDPLANSPTPSSGSSGSSSSSSSAPPSSSTPATGSTSNAPITTASSSSTSSTTASSTAATQSSSASTLPRTGFDAWMPAAAGLALLGLGFAMRRQVLRR